MAQLPQPRAGDLDDRGVGAAFALGGVLPADRVHGVGQEPVLDPQLASVACSNCRRAPRSTSPRAARRPPARRAPPIPIEFSTVTAPALRGYADGSGMYGDARATPPLACRRISVCSSGQAASNSAHASGLRGHLVRAPHVNSAHLPADRPDRIERLVAQQRPVGGDVPVEQCAHVGAERRGRGDLGTVEVPLGHAQKQQVAEVVALVGADEQDAGRNGHCRSSL